MYESVITTVFYEILMMIEGGRGDERECRSEERIENHRLFFSLLCSFSKCGVCSWKRRRTTRESSLDTTNPLECVKLFCCSSLLPSPQQLSMEEFKTRQERREALLSDGNNMKTKVSLLDSSKRIP